MYFHQKIIGLLLKKGKKTKALLFYFFLLKSLKMVIKKNPFALIKKAIFNCMPLFYIYKVFIRRKVLEYPFMLTKRSSFLLGLKWLIIFSKKHKQKNIILNLVKEFVTSSKGLGYACRKKKELYFFFKKNLHLMRLKKKKKKYGKI